MIDTNSKVIAIDIHVNDGMSTSDGNIIYNNYHKVTWEATGMVDRYKFHDETPIDMERQLWASKAAQRLNAIVPVSVSANNTYNQNTREVTVDLSATFFSTLSGDFRFNCYIIEDSINGTQMNWFEDSARIPYYPGSSMMMMPYSHMNVLRTMLGGAWGTTASIPATITDGSTYNHQYKYTLPIAWKENNIKIVALVQQYDADLSKRDILNAEQKYLNITTSVTDEVETGLISVFPNPSKGIINLEVNNADGEDITVEIINISGQVVYTRQFFNSVHERIDLTSYAKGMYFVKVKDTNSVTTKKIVVF